MIEILATGALASVQDGGRHGYAALGVARSGAFDRSALALANRLVGNGEGAAAIEVTLGGLALHLHDALTVALTGAPCPGLDWGQPVSLSAGATIRLCMPPSGLRSYLAVRGGVDVKAELGSRSTDTLGRLGPDRLARGDRLPIGRAQVGDVSEAPAVPSRHANQRLLRVVPGPRDDWFVPGSLDVLTTTAWQVRPDSDRVGIRLDGPRLARAVTGELPSEPTLPGALQVPPDGRPILFGPDAPVSGGYPVVAVVRDDDLDLAAQLRPGDPVRFSPA